MVTAIITDKPYERVIFFQATSQYYGLRTTLRTARHHWGYAQSNESRTIFVGAIIGRPLKRIAQASG